jgi:predicted MFS family arabinose efflux permease
MSVSARVGVTAIATAAMATSTLPLYGVSALGPILVKELDLSRFQLGSLIAVTICAAASLSMTAGRLIDRIGARGGLLGLATVVVATLVAASFAGSYLWLLAALAVAGVGQALANPATNVLIRARIPIPDDGPAVGFKQSGVQVSALLSGAILPSIAVAHGWPWALRTSAVAAVLVVVAARWVQSPPPPVRPARRRRLPSWLFRLALFCFVLATANAAVAAYLPLFAAEHLGYRDRLAGGVLASFGAAGVFGRIWWSKRAAADLDRRPATMLTALSAAAAVCAVPLALATVPHLGALVWVGALGVGVSATAAYAVAMLDVIRNAGADTGRASGLVSVGFFLGFAVGPLAFGFLTSHAGYRPGWIVVVLTLAAAAAAGLPFRRMPSSGTLSELDGGRRTARHR